MKGVTIKTNKGWFVRSFTISDKPPFFNVVDYPVRYKFWGKMIEDVDVNFIIDIEVTPVGSIWYAAIKTSS